MRPGQSPDDDRDRRIDRLVDGELPEADRRALLARLDAEPDGSGWRRLALASLEARCWSEALAPAAAPVAHPRPVAVRPRASARLAAAAGLVLAFTAGWLTRGGPPGGSGAGPGGAPPGLVSAGAGAGAGKVPAPPPPPPPAPEPDEPAREALAADAGPGVDLDAGRWARLGYLVESRQRVVSVGLDDGRKVAVPVNEVRFRYVGGRTY